MKKLTIFKKSKLRDWAIEKAESRHSKIWLSIFSFTEASFLPFPPDFLLIAILLAKQKHRWFFYASLTTIFSVLGGIFGYLIGYIFFIKIGGWIINTYNLQEQISYVAGLFSENTFISIFLSAFTPIPYKVFTIAGGFFHIKIITFLIASILGRGIRFFGVAYLIKLYGDTISKVIYRYMNIFSILVVLIIIFVVYFLF